jgi:hypothetical protein
MRFVNRILVGKSEAKKPLGGSRRGGNGKIIKMSDETECEGVDWI